MKQITFLIWCAVLLHFSVEAKIVKQNLNDNWRFRRDTASSWLIATVPGTIHSDLLAHNIIKEPFWEDNAIDLSDIVDQIWIYSTYFDLDERMLNQKKYRLVFDRLEALAEIKINGKLIYYSTNGLMEVVVNIPEDVLVPMGNILEVKFGNAKSYIDSMAARTALKLPEHNRLYIRKAGYQFGWDFMPPFVTCGISGHVNLLVGEDAGYDVVRPIAKFDPVKFQFIKNGQPIFIKGVNMVPQNPMFIPTKNYYDSIIKFCSDAHINMIRVWGGGFYPPDYFYEQCTAKSIMVWQDLMFANNMYPGDEAFRLNVQSEILSVATRLRKHECIVLYCGNNEINEGWNNWGWGKMFKQSDSVTLWNNYKQMFEVDIPEFIKIVDEERPYIASSPKHGWGRAASMTDGDAHYWGVWVGKKPIEDYYDKVPRFMSEYGMQALPDMQSIEKFCNNREIDVEQEVFKFHQRHSTGFENIRHYLKQYPLAKNNLAYVYFTNLLQRDAIAIAISAHRSAFPYCNGTMLWQLNDSWPGITWSIIDYYNKPKAAYYALDDLYGKNFLTVAKQVYQNENQVIDSSKFHFALTLSDCDFDITNCTTTFNVIDFSGDTLYKNNLKKWHKNETGMLYTTDFFEKKGMEVFRWAECYLVITVKDDFGIRIQKPFFFEQPKVLNLPIAQLKVVNISENILEISTDKIAKDVYLYSKEPTTKFSANYFTLLPNQKKRVIVKNFNLKQPIKAYSFKDMGWEY
jgi:beta-mannosidase